MPEPTSSAVDVLVVDDDETICELMKATLEDDGLEVRTAHSGYQAVQSAEVQRPDLVVLDLMMPGIDGEETAKRLRNVCGSHLPILLISASDDLPATAFRVGAYSQLEKPFDLDHLSIAVRRGIGGSAGQAAIRPQ